MDDQSNIRLIDPHPEGIRRHENSYGPSAKILMHQAPDVIGQTRMVVADRRMGLPQPLSHLLHRPTSRAIDQDGTSPDLANQSVYAVKFVSEILTVMDRER